MDIANKKHSQKNGFSIMEIVIAVGILSVSFITLMSLFAYNIRMEVNSKNKIIASYLAQEAIEVVRQTRDNNWSNNAPGWDDDITYGDSIIIGLNNNSNILAGWDMVNGNEAKKKIYLSDGTYVQSQNASPEAGWTETVFKRYMKIEEDNTTPAEAIKITAYVSYGTGEIQIISYLYNDWH